MPHKHRRRKSSDQGFFDLPPTVVANPLPNFDSVKQASKNGATAPQDFQPHSFERRSRPDSIFDDTPKAFKRLMALQRGIKPRPGHDDCSVRPMKKQKPQSSETEMKPGGTQKTYANHTPDCGPSERMEKLSARVDISFPITGHTKTSRGAELVSTKASQTKTERKLQRMQEEWRALDARRKERVKEAREEVEAQYQHTEFWKAVAPKRKISKHSRGTQSARMANGEHDPLMCTGAKQGRSGSLVGLHDVVKEPPRMSCIPTKKLQSRNGAAFDPFVIPEASGSIYKREQLSEVRREVIDGYRKRKAI